MAGKIFWLKTNNTRPSLIVSLFNPDGTPHDLTGSTDWKLHIKLNNGNVITRTMTVEGLSTAGQLRYNWATGDWSGGTPLISGPGHFEGSIFVLNKGEVEHTMEYEVLGSGGARQTFPNDGYDVLRIHPSIANG